MPVDHLYSRATADLDPRTPSTSTDGDSIDRGTYQHGSPDQLPARTPDLQRSDLDNDSILAAASAAESQGSDIGFSSGVGAGSRGACYASRVSSLYEEKAPQSVTGSPDLGHAHRTLLRQLPARLANLSGLGHLLPQLIDAGLVDCRSGTYARTRDADELLAEHDRQRAFASDDHATLPPEWVRDYDCDDGRHNYACGAVNVTWWPPGTGDADNDRCWTSRGGYLLVGGALSETAPVGAMLAYLRANRGREQPNPKPSAGASS